MADFSHPAGEEFGDGPLRLAFGTACLPHPEKVDKGGEDSFYACPPSRSFGIADGVGGFADIGVDSGEFARKLLAYAYADIQAHYTSPDADSEEDLEAALLASITRLNEESIKGGCTALLGQLTDTMLSVLNLGDSGVMLLRPALRTSPGSTQPILFPRVIFKSSDQTHYFNCPYQLAGESPHVEAPDFIRIRVRTGDLILAASDGVFDNLFDHQLQVLVAQHLGAVWSEGKPVQPHLAGLADLIAEEARKVGLQENQDVITPFALAAHSEGLTFRGGKLDDTTVVVGLVCHEEDPACKPIDSFVCNFELAPAA